MIRWINLRVLLTVVLGLGAVWQVLGQTAPLTESKECTAVSPAPGRPAESAHRHCVKLTWRASVPASKSQRDLVIGYNVYRSQKLHDPKPQHINSKLCTDTTYTDTDVKPGEIYFYVTRGVSAVGESRSSNEIRVEIPRK